VGSGRRERERERRERERERGRERRGGESEEVARERETIFLLQFPYLTVDCTYPKHSHSRKSRGAGARNSALAKERF
jgi:hypothetical protein